MTVNYIPVVVERAFEHGLPSMPLFKLKAPGTITMLQFVDKIRARLKLPPRQAVHFVLEKGLPVGMSQHLKNVYRNNRNKDGLLYLTCASENTFGCIPPYKKPIKSKFPGTEALPFGAPEPVQNVYEDVTDAFMLPINEEEAFIQMMESAVLNNWFHVMDTQYNDQYDEPWPGPDIINNLPVPVHLQSPASITDFMEDVQTSDDIAHFESDDDSDGPDITNNLPVQLQSLASIDHFMEDVPTSEDIGHFDSDDDSDVPVYLAQFMASELIDTSEEETSGEEA